MKDQVVVLVTGVGGGAVGYQVLHALRCMGDKYRIVATDASEFSCGLYEAAGRYVVPLASSPDYLSALERIVAREGVDIVIPGTEAEAEVLAGADVGCCILVNPSAVVALCADKALLGGWLEKHGIAVPHSVTADHWQDLVMRSGFPIIGKPTVSTSGSRGVAILKDEEEVGLYLREMPSKSVVFQEYVGSAEAEYTVGVMVSPEGEIIDSIVIHRRLVGMTLGVTRCIDGKDYSLSTGISQGTVVKHPVIQAACEQLSLKMGIRGPANIQLRLVGDIPVVFEVHARFSGTTSIRADVGFNEPDVLIHSFLFGERIGRIDYQANVAVIRGLSCAVVPLETLRAVPRS